MTDKLTDAIARWNWRQNDIAHQALWNNIYDNNPGELERWADDGGQPPKQPHPNSRAGMGLEPLSEFFARVNKHAIDPAVVRKWFKY